MYKRCRAYFSDINITLFAVGNIFVRHNPIEF